MDSVIISTRDAWVSLDFVDLQKSLESTAVELASNHDKNDASRSNLIAQTRDFRKSVSEEVKKAVSQILKCYQSEFDALYKRCAFTEEAYLTIYKKMIDLPNPVLALNEIHSFQKKANKSDELDLEIRKLKDTNEEMKNELSNLSNLEKENKRLRKANAELTESLNEQVQVQTAKLQKEFRDKFELHEHERMVLQAESEEKIAALKEKLISITQALELSQSEVFKLKTKVDVTETGRSSELELLIEELEKANGKVSALELELGNLRQVGATTINQSSPEFDQLRLKIEELESELSKKETENCNLIRMIDDLRSANRDLHQSTSDQISNLESVVSNFQSELQLTRQQLNERSDYDEILRELNLLKSIEFPAETTPTDPNSTSNMTATSADTNASKEPLESLLIKKNKTLENQIAECNAVRDQLEIELNQLRVYEAESKQQARQQAELIQLLESDLYRLQTTFNDAAKSGFGESHAGGLSPSRVESQLLEEAIQGHSLGSSYTNSADNTLLHIVQHQRDRFRTRAEELEQNEAHLRQQLVALQHDLNAVRADNVKLYEKIRFLHSYANPIPPPRSPKIISLANEAQTSSPYMKLDSDPTELKYSQAYEAQLDPFNQFSRSERQRKYENLRPHEKVMFRLGRLVLGDRKARLVAFLYVIVVHLLVFMSLYKAAHFQQSALEAETNCLSRYAEHMRSVHNQNPENLHN